jgi:hypothetical protein
MLRRILACLICFVAAMSYLRTDDTVARITILVFNDARLPETDIHDGTREAAAIFTRAGIHTVFVDCAPSALQAALYPDCQIPISPKTLIVHIVSNAMADRLRLDPAALGSALFPEDSSFALTAMVCGERAAELAHGPPSRGVGRLLGALIAHEVGDLLIGPGSHSPSGIMHSPWTKKETTSFVDGAMDFTLEQATLVRQRVLKRSSAISPPTELAQQANDRGDPPTRTSPP